MTHVDTTRRQTLAGIASAGAVVALPRTAGARRAEPRWPGRTLSREEATTDVELMIRGLETIHPGLHRYAAPAELDQVFAQLRRAAAAAITDSTLYLHISAATAAIRCDHTKAEQPPDIENWRDGHASHLPFRFRLVEGRMLVVAVAPGAVELEPGMEVLEVNGQSVPGLVRRLGSYVARDGRTDFVIPAKLADDGDLMGSDLDHFGPYLQGTADAVRLKVRRPGGLRTRTIEAARIDFATFRDIPNDGRPWRSEFGSSTVWRMAGQGATGILTIDSFVNYRNPVDAPALYARALDALRADGMGHLVVDLRRCGGGSDDAALALIDAVATRPYVYQRSATYKAIRYGDLPEHISSWGDRDSLFNPQLENFTANASGGWDLRPDQAPDILQPREPVQGAFTGPVTVLCGPGNASAATMAIACLKEMGRVRIVGERTGGSAEGPTAGRIFNLSLPASGIVVRIPVIWNRMNISRFDPGLGITPDEMVPETVAARLAGRDLALERAVTA
jgi:C-terminal processing protease CtpA/Prc